MKNKITVASLNVSQCSLLTGKTRETVSRAARGLQSSNGASNAKFFDSRKLLQLLYLGESGPTYSEAMRQLALARTRQIEIDVEIKRGSRIPLDDVARSDNEIFTMFAATLKANHNKVLTQEIINEIFEGIRDWANDWRRKADAAEPCHPTLWKS